MRATVTRFPRFPVSSTPASYRRVALFPVSDGAHRGAIALAASAHLGGGGFAVPVRGLLPLPQVPTGAAPSLLHNVPLWGFVSLLSVLCLLWGTIGSATTLPPAMSGVAEALVNAELGPLTAASDSFESAARTLRRVVTAVPAARSVVLARLRPGSDRWTVVEVDGATLRVAELERLDAVLAAAGFSLAPGDRVVAVPNTSAQRVVRALPFSVDDGGVTSSQRSAAGTVGEALASVGIDLRTADVVQPPAEATVAPGMRVVISRGQPVTIAAPDVQLQTRSRAATVGDLIAESGVPLGPLDRVEPALSDAVPAFGTVRVVRVREEEQRETEQVTYSSRMQYADGLLPGTRRIQRAGVAGVVERIFRVVFEDDAEVRRELLDEHVVQPVVDEIILQARPIAASLGLPLPAPLTPLAPVPAPQPTAAPLVPVSPIPDLPVRRVLNVVATAYDPGPASTGKGPGHPAYGITATGQRAGYGTVAVDPRVIPFFTRMYIPGYGYGVATDTGGAIVGNRIDLFYPTYGEALQWGRRAVPVYILE